MFLQIMLPGFGAEAGQALAQLGVGIRNLIDPNFERRQQIQNFLLTNPDSLQQFADAQRLAEEKFETQVRTAGKTAGDARQKFVGAGEPPNVLEAFGFDFRRTKELLGQVPPSPERELAKASAEIQLEVTQELRKSGIVKLETNKRLAEARLGEALTEGQLAYLNEFNEEANRLSQSTNPKDQMEGRIMHASINNQPFLQELQFRRQLELEREELGLRERVARLKTLTDIEDQSIELTKLRLSAEDNLRGSIDQWNEAQAKGNAEQRRIAAWNLNRQTALLRGMDPSGAGFALQEVRGLLPWTSGFEALFLAPAGIPENIKGRWETVLGQAGYEAWAGTSELQDFLKDPALEPFIRELRLIGLDKRLAQQLQQVFDTAQARSAAQPAQGPTTQAGEVGRRIGGQIAPFAVPLARAAGRGITLPLRVTAEGYRKTVDFLSGFTGEFKGVPPFEEER